MSSVPEQKPHRRGFFDQELIGELILLAAVAGFFTYIVISAQGWKFSAVLMPAIAVAIGIPFWIWRFVEVIRAGLRRIDQQKLSAAVMDVGFYESSDPAAERNRFYRIVIAIFVLYACIWLFGFHVTVPLWTFIYMWRFGRVPLITSLIVAALLLAVIIGLYDTLLDTDWNEPLVLQWLRRAGLAV